MGLNLQQIEDETNMRWKYLEALEQGNYQVIPGEAYVKGFLRNYAAFLELDSEEILRIYKEQQEKKPVETLPQEQPIKKKKSRSKPNKKPLLFVSMAAFALLIVASVILANQGEEVEGPGLVDQKPTPQQNTGSDPKPVPNSSPSPAPKPEPQPQPHTDPPVAQGPDKNVLVLKAANGRCWIRVESDGTNVYEGHLNLGDSKEFSGKTFKVRYGNAGAIRVTLNGEDLGAPGPMGMPQDKEYGN